MRKNKVDQSQSYLLLLLFWQMKTSIPYLDHRVHPLILRRGHIEGRVVVQGRVPGASDCRLELSWLIDSWSVIPTSPKQPFPWSHKINALSHGLQILQWRETSARFPALLNGSTLPHSPPDPPSAGRWRAVRCALWGGSSADLQINNLRESRLLEVSSILAHFHHGRLVKNSKSFYFWSLLKYLFHLVRI